MVTLPNAEMVKAFINSSEYRQRFGPWRISPLRRLPEKVFLCANSVVLCASVVELSQEDAHHRDTEIAQRTTELTW